MENQLQQAFSIELRNLIDAMSAGEHVLQQHCLKNDEMRSRLFTVEMKNERLYGEIETEQKELQYNRTRTGNKVDQLKKDLSGLFDIAESLEATKQHEATFVTLWEGILKNLPNQWFFQDDESINKMIDEADSRIDAATKAVQRLHAEMQWKKEKHMTYIAERKEITHILKIFVDDLKRTTARLEVIAGKALKANKK